MAKTDPRMEAPSRQDAPRPQKPVAVSLVPLDYARASNPKVAKWKQFLVGMATAYGVLGLTLVCGNVAPKEVAPWAVMGVLAASLVSLFVIRDRTGWSTFLPGVLTGVLAIPLVAAVVCSIGFATGLITIRD